MHAAVAETQHRFRAGLTHDRTEPDGQIEPVGQSRRRQAVHLVAETQPVQVDALQREVHRAALGQREAGHAHALQTGQCAHAARVGIQDRQAGHVVDRAGGSWHQRRGNDGLRGDGSGQGEQNRNGERHDGPGRGGVLHRESFRGGRVRGISILSALRGSGNRRLDCLRCAIRGRTRSRSAPAVCRLASNGSWHCSRHGAGGLPGPGCLQGIELHFHGVGDAQTERPGLRRCRPTCKISVNGPAPPGYDLC